MHSTHTHTHNVNEKTWMRARPSIGSLTLRNGCKKASIQHKIEKGENNDKRAYNVKRTGHDSSKEYDQVFLSRQCSEIHNSIQHDSFNPSLFSAHFSLCYYFHYPIYVCMHTRWSISTPYNPTHSH